MLAILFLLMSLLVACGDNPSGPSSHDRLDGQVLYRYDVTALPTLDYKPLSVQRVSYWTFENRAFTYRSEILSAHPDSRLPAAQSTTYWMRGNYWAEGCQTRQCTYLFERTDGEHFDYVEMELVGEEPNIFTLTLVFGEFGVRVQDTMYILTDRSNLSLVRSGALNGHTTAGAE